MAKFTTVKYTDLFNTEGAQLTNLAVQSATKSKVVFADPMSGDQIIFQGKNLRMEDGRPDSGIITKLTIANEDGVPLQVHSGFKLNVDLVSGGTLIEFTVGVIVTLQLHNTKHVGSNGTDSITAFKGNDVLLGRGGDDTLSGGLGRDRLTGGEGNDTFTFAEGFRNDTVTDFDADGGVGNQDLIGAKFADATITQVGANTLVDFGDGDTLTLLNINTAQISSEDFTL